MSYRKTNLTRLSLITLLLHVLALCLSFVTAAAQTTPQQARTRAATPATSRAANGAETDAAAPPFHEYKGVSIGMPMEEARKKLGSPTEKSDTQDFYAFSEKETAQVYYEDKKVSALAVIYVGTESGAPLSKAVFGSETAAKPDGSMHRMERYPKAGYWLSYSRTAGDMPLITITLKKLD